MGAYWISRGSANANASLILIAEKANNPDGALGLSFVFHPLSPTQRISTLGIVLPPAISTASETALPPAQELNLSIDARLIEHYKSASHPPSESAYMTVWDGNIPVILEARYVFADQSLIHRGLYKLKTHIVWQPSRRPVVSFQDVVFDRMVGSGNDYGPVLTRALIEEEEAQRRLFNPQGSR
jgi:hypothetical protein